MKTKNIECNLCGSDRYEVIYENNVKELKKETGPKDAYLISEGNLQKPNKLFKCNNCGLVFAERDKDLKLYTDMYVEMIDKEYVEEEKGRRQSSFEILRRIEQYKANGRLLDIGCANGFLLDEARKKGWEEVYGVEISKWAAAYAREKLDLNVIGKPLEEAKFSDEFFDAVIMLDVLEHLSDPRATLMEVRRILKEDGILYISTPNISSFLSSLLRAKWWGINKFHLFYFSKKTLAQLLESCSFKVKKYNPHIRIFSIGYWKRRIRPYNHVLYKTLDIMSRTNGLGDMPLRINLRDQIEVLAVKSK